MKNILRSAKWLFVFTVLLQFKSLAQVPGPGCPNVLDQNQPGSNTGSQGLDQWQIFRAGITGKLTRIDIYTNTCPTTTVTLNVYAGQGIGGALLSSTSYTMTSWCNAVFPMDIPVGSAPNVTSGADYTFRILTTSNLLDIAHNGNPYPFGHYFSDAYGLQTNWDLKFATYVQQTNYPVANITPASATTFCSPGTVQLDANLGSFTYQWWNSGTAIGGATGASYVAPASGQYIAVVTNTLTSCWSPSNMINVVVNPQPTVSAASATVCNGSTATLSATAAGGTPGYSYNWFNVPTSGSSLANTQNYTTPVLPPGITNYYPQVTDINGCISSRPAVPVTVNDLPAITSTNAMTICTGQTLGLNLTSNQAPVTYQWIAAANANVSGESTSTEFTSTLNNTLLNLTGSVQTVTYTVTPTNTTTGCVGNPQIVTVTVNAAPVATADPDLTVCEGAANVVSSNAAGGVAPYTFNWFDAPSAGMLVANTQSFNPPTATAGTYTYYIEATGANGCIGPRDPIVFTVNQRPTIMTATGIDITCSGANDGQLVGVSSNGTPPYEYSFTGGAPFFPSPITGLSAGNYTLYTRDANNCVSSNWQSASIIDPLPVSLTIASQTNVDCFGNNTGSISVSSSGGTGPIEYSINGSAYSPSSFFTGLFAGSYTITAKDMNNCLSSPQIATITEPTQLNLNYTGTLSSCSGVPLNISLSATGGTGGYTYSWIASDNANTSGESTISNSTTLINDNITNTTPSNEAVNYTLTVTDANSCVATHTPFFTIYGTPTITNALAGSTCSGVSFSQVLAASQPATFQWVASNNPNTPDEETTLQFTSTLTDVVTNPMATAENIFYSLTPISSPEGCVGTSSTFTLTVNPLPTITSSATPSIICEGASSTFNASGANTYSWNPAAFLSSPTSSSPTFSGASASAYSYTVTATNTLTTCSNTSIVNITVNATPSAPTLTSNSPVCAGSTLNLGTPSIAATYSWSGPNAFFSNVQNPSIAGISVAGAGTYSLTITSASGCVSPSATIPITINSLPTAPIAVQKEFCAGTSLNPGTGACPGTSTNSFEITSASVVGSTAIDWYFGDPSSGGTLVTNSFGANCRFFRTGSLSAAPSTPGTQGETRAAMIAGTSGQYSMWAKYADATGCYSPASEVKMIIRPSLAAPAVPSGTNSICNNSNGIAYSQPVPSANATIPINTLTNTSTLAFPTQYVWSASVAGVSTATPNLQNPNFDYNIGVQPNPTQAVQIRTLKQYLTATTSGSFCPTTNTTLVVTVYGTTLGGSVTPANLTICDGASTGNITLTGQRGTVSFWERSFNAGAYTAIAGTAGLTTYSEIPPNGPGIYNYRAVVQNGPCASATSTINTITVSPNTIGGTISGGTSPACSGANSGTLTLTGHTGNVIGWEFSTDSGLSWTPIVNTSTTQAYSNLTTTTWYRAIVQSGVCASATSSTQIITIDNPPTTANAGPDQSLCNLTTTTLFANSPVVGTGSWSVISGTAVVTSPTSPSSGVTGLTIGASSTLRWTISNGTCPASTDDIVVTSNPNPNISGTLSACEGGTSTLSGTGSPNATTPWVSSFTSTATVNAIGIVSAAINGTTTITYMDINSCTATATFTVNAVPNASITAGGPLTFCSGNTVTFTASPNSGVNYQWKHGAANVGTNTSTYTTGNAGNHTVIVTDLITGCSDTSNMLNVNLEALPTGTTSTVDVSCNGGATGSVTVIPSGTGPFMYSYNGGPFIATATQTGLTAGNYTVIVQSGAGCNSTDILYTINEPTAVSGSLVSSTNPTCFGSGDGNASVSALGGNGTYNYSLNGGTYSPSNTFVGLVAGSYTVDIQDGNGCLSSTPVNFSIIDPTQVIVNSTANDVTCFGGNNGSIIASASGGAGGYQYSIDNITFAGSNSFTNLTANSYTIYVNDASGCLGTNITFVGQPASGLLVNATGDNTICSGDALNLAINSSGGSAPVSLSWYALDNTQVTGESLAAVNSSTINDALSLPAGSDPFITNFVSYLITATDNNSCTITDTISVEVYATPYANLSTTLNPVCENVSTTINAVPFGDFIGFQTDPHITILNSTSADFIASISGNVVITYTLTMNTGNLCSGSSNITLTVTPSPAAPTLSANSPTCAGSAINLSSNTIAGATYSWSGPNGFTSTLEDPTIAISLPSDAGTYTCTANVAGCTSTSTVIVVVNPKPQALITGISTTFCANETFTLDGSNSLANSSSITNYQWQLNNVNIPGANAITYTGNTPGNYKLVVTNDLGCTDTTLTPNIANADPIPTPVINGATAFCTGNNFTIDAFLSGAGGASVIDNYEWLYNGISVSSGPSNDTYIATLGGDYQLIVLNSNGCKDTTALFTITENPIPGLPSVTPDPINVCVGSSANISVNSPNGGSTYTWASINAETSVSFATGNSNTVNGLAAGIASITVNETSALGCVGPTYSVTVNVISAPIAIASFTSNDTICYNGNASVSLNLITGASYNWTSSIGSTSTSQSVTFNNITTTGNVAFYGTITDAAGCTSLTDTLNLFVLNQPTVPVISSVGSVCPSQSFTLNASPVIPGANYFWTDPSSTIQNAIDLISISIPSATTINAGPYTLNYIDPQGCISATSLPFTQSLNPTPIVSITGLTTICSGNNTTLNANTSVGTASAYQWYKNGTAIGGATSANLIVNTPGNYNVEIILSTGCIDSASVATTVNVSSGPSVVVNPLTSAICAGSSTTINASGAVSYSWDNGATTSSIIVNPTTTTSYIVTGTDANGCTNNDTAIVIVNALPTTPVITAGSTSECAGTNVSLSSNSSLTNTWINTSTLAVIGTTQAISHTETVAGTYNYGVYVTDANSCNSATATVAITFNPCLTNLISDNATTNSNTPVSGNYLTNDGSPSIFITVNIISGPSNGTMNVSTNGNFTYTPAGNYSGYDMVVVQVCDVTPTCLNDTIYIIVNPNIIGDTYTVNGLATPNSIIGNVLTNDAGTGISGNVTLVNSVTNGILVIDTLGNFTYTPNTGFCGNDLFTYNVCDQNGLCGNAVVNLIITCDSTVTTTTGFSPNGDGVNDNWIIQGIETTQNTVTIFDRWGNQVNSFTNYNNTNTTWNGKNSNGIELPAGTYFYSIDIQNEKPKKGWVEITK